MKEIVFHKEVPCPWTETKVKKIAGEINKRVKLRGSLEVNIIGAAAMKKLNRITRGINKVTDVLSFAWREDKRIKSDFLGQVYVCYPRVASQAKIFKVPAQEEFVRILTHGILHLAGYDHMKKKDAARMYGLQELVVGKF